MKDGLNEMKVEVVSLRPDEPAQKFLRKKLRKKEVARNKSALYRRIFNLGIEAMKASEEAA